MSQTKEQEDYIERVQSILPPEIKLGKGDFGVRLLTCHHGCGIEWELPLCEPGVSQAIQGILFLAELHGANCIWRGNIAFVNFIDERLFG